TKTVNIQAHSDFDLLTSLQDGLLDAGSSSLGLSLETSTLDSHAFSLSSTSTDSEPPNGSLNAPNLSRTTAFSPTPQLPQFDSTSFTTDNQRPSWPTQPQHQQPPASDRNSNSYQNQISYNQQQDFQLFPTDPPASSSTRSWPREARLTVPNTHRQRTASAAALRQFNPAAFNQAISHSRVRSIANSPRPPVPLFSNQQFQPQTRPQRSRVMSTPNMLEDCGGLFDFTNLDMPGEDMMNIPMQSYTNQEAPRTVSPQELMLDASCPPSTAFTDLSTPSFESPGTFSHDTSPLFDNIDDLPGQEGWESLFPGDPTQIQDDILPSPAIVAARPTSQPKPQVVASPIIRAENVSKESPRTRPVSTRHSSVSGVTKRAREKAALPPITVDESDPVAVKRARNTEAARKSRARKVELQESLERRIQELESQLEQARQETEHWKGLAGQ
ncbi:hypothetical protein FQN49_008127, partial [Arthroderma sp. PD_2]